MKKTFLTIFSVLTILMVNAQDSYQSDEVRTIFSKSKSNGGYGAFTVGYSKIGGYDAMVTGARGAFIFDHIFAIGLGGYGFINNIDFNNYPNRFEPNMSLVGGYGGLLLEPIIAGKSPVHLSFPILIGGGGVTLVDTYSWDYWSHLNPGYEYSYDSYIVFEPAAELEFNVAKFFRIAAAVSYRYTSDIKLYNADLVSSSLTSPDALRGFNYSLTFKLGKF